MIELLIVVAIIGVLAAVGIPVYNGYILQAKINATKENHIRIASFIAASMTKCAATGGTVELNTSKGPSRRSTTKYKCSEHVRPFAHWFNYHFIQEGFKNPYGDPVTGSYLNNATYASKARPPHLGAIHITGQIPGPGGTQQFRIWTYVTDTGSTSERYLLNTIRKE